MFFVSATETEKREIKLACHVFNSYFPPKNKTKAISQCTTIILAGLPMKETAEDGTPGVLLFEGQEDDSLPRPGGIFVRCPLSCQGFMASFENVC